MASFFLFYILAITACRLLSRCHLYCEIVTFMIRSRVSIISTPTHYPFSHTSPHQCLSPSSRQRVTPAFNTSYDFDFCISERILLFWLNNTIVSVLSVSVWDITQSMENPFCLLLEKQFLSFCAHCVVLRRVYWYTFCTGVFVLLPLICCHDTHMNPDESVRLIKEGRTRCPARTVIIAFG